MSIKNLSEDDRPREKFLTKGRDALSDAELLAIIMGSGNREESAVDLARRILQTYGHNWNALSEVSVADLMKFRGIGEAKAISITTALEIGRRRAMQEQPKRLQITQSSDIFEMMAPLLSDLPNEEFWVIFLNQSNKVLQKKPLSKGGISGTVVDVRLMFKMALEHYATAIIVVHNHPSGSISPSEQDLEITKKIKEAGALLDIRLLDHIIIAKNKYFSFADEGVL
ncbi:DNA repair protein RadC [Riemerella anatipestifer]|uniref:RadC family protein n=1 Tax=Riemerella anatipestifer TaxID=34085 RepID=UPI0012AEAE13|nr:DNA repair protein RadC [Riemerella anatipestifer]USL95061.1 DNA repair protein RadC [Riemerella anatipestifer]